MNIVFHIGAHGTDGEMILRSLMRNRDRLWPEGCAMPAPGQYRSLLHSAIADLRGTEPTQAMRELLLDSIVTDDGVKRLILSHEVFMGGRAAIIQDGALYPNAASTFSKLAALLPADDYEFFLALKNPVSLLMDQLRAMPEADYNSVMGKADPRNLRWAPVIRRMLPHLGANRLVIWCREDTPFILPELLRMILDVPPDRPFRGAMALLPQLLSEEGNAWLTAEWERNPPATINDRRASVEEALAQFANLDKIDDIVVLPGWSQRLVDDITEIYHRDIAEIAALPGVEFLNP